MTSNILVELPREFYFALQNILVNVHRILVSEWIDACVHLVDENAQGPPVNGLAMSLI
jgi:hypothetical protein